MSTGPRHLVRPLSETGSTLGGDLPAGLAEAAAGRLGWVAALFSVTFAFMHLLYRTLAPAQTLPAHQLITAFSVLLGAAMAGLAWSRRLPASLTLDIGLIFQVVAALTISLGESALPLSEGLVRGHSAIAIWLVLFVLVVPSPAGKAALAAFVTACMGPLGMAITIAVKDYPRPLPQQWAVLYTSSFVMVGASVILSRFVYKLGVHSSGPAEVGSYELLDLLGEGGMGEVWRARHRLLVREAAVKLIRPERLGPQTGSDIDAVRRRFEREARATAALNSPFTVAVHDYGVADDGSFYYVMELLRGLDLEGLVEKFGPVSARRAVYILIQVCDSLAEAHAAGLTHRDVKPRNIFLCRLGTNYDCVKVLDFGLVKVRSASGESRLTREGVTTGTPAYMSPEMALGHHDVDARTDIYATGCVAYWLLTGQLVFDAPNALSMALEHVQRAPVRPSQRTEIDIPPVLEEIVMRCLEKDPAKRPQSARELKTLLERTPLAEEWTNDLAEEWWRRHAPIQEAPFRADQTTA
ncbi:MAG: serine/threonine-protein kinase [Bryobacteraceae bacterium]